MLLSKKILKTSFMMECKDVQYWILWYSICSWKDYMSKQPEKPWGAWLFKLCVPPPKLWLMYEICWLTRSDSNQKKGWFAYIAVTIYTFLVLRLSRVTLPESTTWQSFNRNGGDPWIKHIWLLLLGKHNYR